MNKFRITYEQTIEREALIEINDDNCPPINSDEDLIEYIRNETFYNVEFLEEEEVSGNGPDIDTISIIGFE